MEDLSLVSRCISGDKQAWDEFLNRYARLIFRFIYSCLRQNNPNHISSETADDLFQEIIVTLAADNCKKLRSFEGRNGCSFASWLRQITVHFTIDHLRKARRTVTFDEVVHSGFTLKETLEDISGRIIEAAEFKDQVVHLNDCVGALSIDEKYFLELHFVQELSIDSLSEHFMVSRGSLDMRKSRIVEKLRDCFRHKGILVDCESAQKVK